MTLELHEVQGIRELAAQGLYQREIAKRIARSQATVSRVMRKFNIVTAPAVADEKGENQMVKAKRSCKRFTSTEIETAKALAQRGATLTEIGQKLGRPVSGSIGKILIEAGIPYRGMYKSSAAKLQQRHSAPAARPVAADPLDKLVDSITAKIMDKVTAKVTERLGL